MYTFTINQATTWKLDVVWTDSSGSIVDVTNYHAKIQFRKSHQDNAVLYEMSTDNSKIVLTGPAGKITCTASKEDTKSFKFTNAVFDLLMTSPGGEATRLFRGTVVIDPAVTR